MCTRIFILSELGVTNKYLNFYYDVGCNIHVDKDIMNYNNLQIDVHAEIFDVHVTAY